jgi:uncharacterized membrane protein YfcA
MKMTDVPPSSPPPEPEPQRPLEYASPIYDPNRPAGGVPYVVQILIGFVSFFIAEGMAFGVAIAINPSGPAPFFLIPGATLVAMIGFSIVAYVRWRWHGMIVGALIALGLVLLGCGVCAAIMANLH